MGKTTKAVANPTSVVINERMRVALQVTRRSAIDTEIASYANESDAVREWKAAAAGDYFETNKIDVPEAMLQRLEWAQAQLAAAEGAVVSYLLRHEPGYRRIERTISAYQLAREVSTS